MKKIIYRVRLAFWLWELSGCTIRKAWVHAYDAMCADYAWKPKALAEVYIKHWGIR